MKFEEIPSNFLNFDKIFEKAVKSLNEDGISMDEFKDLYGEEQVNGDIQRVEKLEKVFDAKNSEQKKMYKKLATIFEAIINEQAELNEWLGSNIMTMSASKHDDYMNGVDSIVEINEDGSLSHMGLAIDATFSSDVDDKFERIRKNIENGKLATIKYFKSTNSDFMGQLKQIPRVVIGADAETINELIELWVNGKKKELSEHPIQFQIIDLIIRQLESFKDYAKENKKELLVEKFNKLIVIFVNILNEKEKKIEDSGERDRMFEVVTQSLSSVIDV